MAREALVRVLAVVKSGKRFEDGYLVIATIASFHKEVPEAVSMILDQESVEALKLGLNNPQSILSQTLTKELENIVCSGSIKAVCMKCGASGSLIPGMIPPMLHRKPCPYCEGRSATCEDCCGSGFLPAGKDS